MFLSICILLAALSFVRTEITSIHLTNDNFVSLRGPVTSQSIAELISNLLDKTSNERYIYLNTNGGSVDAGKRLIHVIKDLQNNNIEVNCIADTAISMEFVIFQSCSKRYVLSYSTRMQHQMSLSGNQDKLFELNSYMSHINKIEDTVNKMQANRINITLIEFKSRNINFSYTSIIPIKVETKLIKNEEKTNILDIINSNFKNLNKFKSREFDRFIDIVGVI